MTNRTLWQSLVLGAAVALTALAPSAADAQPRDRREDRRDRREDRRDRREDRRDRRH